MGYGQTGSGKSFTISGLTNNWEHRGLLARVISQMFAAKVHRQKSNKIQYSVSYVELHGKEAKDLLNYETENRVRINDRNPFKDISVIIVESEEDALRKIFEGEIRRSSVKGSTYLVSHLATSVITFHVSNASLITSWGAVTTAKMHIIEMAGTGTVGKNDCWKPASDIGMANVSKAQLEQFFSYLSEDRMSTNSLIRSNNLLRLLGSAFPISCIIRFISHVRIKEEDLIITLSTLRFTTKLAKLKPVRVKENVKYKPQLVLYRLQDEVNALKKELMMNDLFLHQEAVTNISKSRMDQINRNISDYLNGKISDFTLFNVSQAQIVLKSIKDVYNRLIAKELEVENLKETYENLLNTLTTLPEETTLRSHDQNDVQPNVPEEPSKEVDKGVGNLNNSGMTLGPYTEDEDKEERADAAETRKYSTPSKQIHKINISEVRQSFERFLKEKKDYAKIKEKLDIIEKTLNVVREKFSNSIENYFQAKRNLDNERDKLSKQQQIRHIMEVEACSNEKQEVPEIEKIIHRDILCHQKALIILEDQVNQEQDEINKLLDQHVELCLKLESGFREYCKTVGLLLCPTDRPMKMLLEHVDNESLEVTRQKFIKLQRTILRKMEDTARMKKEHLYPNRT